MNDGLLHEPVLMLNANFEPLQLCLTKRALMLVYTGKATTLLNGRGIISTGSAKFELPSVIKLSHMVKRPYPKVPLSKREILRRDNNRCQYCGRQGSFLTLDHVVPRRLGGGHTWQNLVAACAPCNRRKGGEMLNNANMTLLQQPRQPTASPRYLFGRHLERHREWEQFIEGW